MNFFQAKDMKILLVDDNAANLDVLRSTLQPEGYQLGVARDGEKALDIVSRFQPDLILLDIMMPNMDGYETCKHLKADTAYCDIPIIFITAKTERADMLKGFDMGCVDYITKPFHRAEVCARVNTQLQLRASQQALKALNQQKDRFLGIVAHDLRNPLSGIIAYTDLMMQDFEISKETQQECLHTLHSTSWQMLSLVNDLLDLSVIERGELVIQTQLNQLQPLIEQRLKIYQFKAKGRGINIYTQYAPVPDFYFDANRLVQVIDNLIGNALKFSPTYSNINIQLSHKDSEVQLRISDQGEGLPEGFNLSTIFQKGASHVPSGEKSTGLGLAIIKKIIDAHQGRIEVDSEKDQGTVFTVYLPLRVC